MQGMGITVLRLPPYYCELNPIEFVWAQVKRRLAKTNTNPTKNNATELIRCVIEEIQPAEWKKYVEHVESKVESKYSFKLTNIQPIRFTVNTGSSDEEVDW